MTKKQALRAAQHNANWSGRPVYIINTCRPDNLDASHPKYLGRDDESYFISATHFTNQDAYTVVPSK